MALEIIDPVEIPDDVFSLWAVYERPTDFPEGYMARVFVDLMNGSTVVTGATTYHMKSTDLEEIRTQMRLMGKTLMIRRPDDEPHIVETWF